MARKAVKQELTRERIIQAARELFVTQGYQLVSMRSIGKELGYSHGAIYYHFKEKAELFYAVIKEDFGLLGRMLNEVLENGPPNVKAKVERIMLDFIRFGLEFPHHYEIMFLTNDPELRRYALPEQASCFQQFSDVVNEAVKGKEEVLSSIDNLPWHLFLSIHGFITHYIHSRKNFRDVMHRAEEHVKFLCSILE